jgi:hypothetical protein
MKQDIHTFVVECDVCQCNKGETFKASGTLQPLPIPPAIWRDISMDFIVVLPKSNNKSVIMVVVYRLYKYDHFCALQHPFIASTVAQLFMDHIFKLHGMPHDLKMKRLVSLKYLQVFNYVCLGKKINLQTHKLQIFHI